MRLAAERERDRAAGRGLQRGRIGHGRPDRDAPGGEPGERVRAVRPEDRAAQRRPGGGPQRLGPPRIRGVADADHAGGPERHGRANERADVARILHTVKEHHGAAAHVIPAVRRDLADRDDRLRRGRVRQGRDERPRDGFRAHAPPRRPIQQRPQRRRARFRARQRVRRRRVRRAPRRRVGVQHRDRAARPVEQLADEPRPLGQEAPGLPASPSAAQRPPSPHLRTSRHTV